jgi:hypothetical protein
VPHGRFRGDGHVPLDVLVPPHGSVQVELEVACPTEPPGALVTNAFLILRAQSAEEPWRILARMRIEFDTSGVPVPIVETVTVQSIA